MKKHDQYGVDLLYNVPLLCRIPIEDDTMMFYVMRVPGGWIFSMPSPEIEDGYPIYNDTFVPHYDDRPETIDKLREELKVP